MTTKVVKKELVEEEYEKRLILNSGTKLILVLENINTNTKYGRNVLTSQSKSILTILH